MRESSIPRRLLPKSLLALMVLLTGSNAWACNVPVFRYALENWRADPYQVVFFHRGELTPKQQTLLTMLGPDGKAGKISANVEVIAVDLDKAKADDPRSKDDLALWESQNTETLPWMVVQYPLSVRNRTVVWAGEPTENAIGLLLDSPKRREIAERIIKGHTAVWVFLESGNEAEDNEAYLRLTTELKRCEQELELPPPDPQDVADGLISVDQSALKVQFSTLRISRDDPQEARFIDMLLDWEPDLRDEEFADKPMAFPVFGRGRALSFLIGAGIGQEVIFSDSQFLVGPCSCQVKVQNPGVDMLMAVDWDRNITPQIPVDNSQPPLPVFTPLAEGSEAETPEKPIAEETQATAEKPAAQADGEAAEPAAPAVATTTAEAAPDRFGSKVMTTTAIVLAAAVVGIAVLSVVLWKKPTI